MHGEELKLVQKAKGSTKDVREKSPSFRRICVIAAEEGPHCAEKNVEQMI